MDESSIIIRLECLKLAQWDGDDDGQVIERARAYADFVLGAIKPTAGRNVQVGAWRHPLLREIEDFIKQHPMTENAFDKAVVNSQGFIWRLRKGSDCRSATAQKVREQMAAYRKNGRFNSAAPADFAQAAE